MSVTIDRECVEHAQAPRTRFHRAVSLQSRAAMLGAQVGIRSLVAAWMAAPDFPWPTQDRPFGAAALGPNPFRATTWKRDPAEPGVARPGQPACDIVDRPCRSAVRSLTRWTAIDGCTRPATVRATLWWPSDSAGGYLAFMTALSVSAAGLPKPAGAEAISPLTAACGTARDCPVFPPRAAAMFARYLARAHARITVNGQEGPLASPVAEDLRDMPPVMIHAGVDELLVGDAELMTDRLRASGVPCDLHLWAGQVHDFAVAGNATPEIRRAIKMIGRFVQDVTAQHR